MEAARDIRHSPLRAALGTLGVVACHVFTVAVLTFVVVVISQAFPGLYEDFDAELPSGTILAINLSNFLFAYRYFILLLLVPDAIAYYFLARLPLRLNWLASIWAMTPIVAALALFGFMAPALILPYQRLLEALR